MQQRSVKTLAVMVLTAFAAACGSNDTQTAGTVSDTVGVGTTTGAGTPGMGTTGTGTGMGTGAGTGTTAGAAGEDTTRLDETIAAAEGGLTNLPVNAAVSNIEGWERRLREAGNPALNPIADDLAQLRQELQRTPIDGAAVGRLLSRLGEQTSAAATGADPAVSQRLQRLGNLLSQAGSQLSR